MGLQRSRILCVEDDKDSSEMIKKFLQLSNGEYLVTTAEDGATALDLISKEPFDLYILDNWLPEMDGMEICRRIRESGSTKPIIFFSAMVRAADRESALEAGANEYLLKPNDLDIIAETVERLLGDES
jgi:two-component system response regulator QseB